MTTYFGFAIADSMFPQEAIIQKSPVVLSETKEEIETATCILNASHTATIEALKTRFNLTVEIPEKPPLVNLQIGDSVIVMGVRGLPRLTENRHYTEDEINQASFVFSRYTVK